MDGDSLSNRLHNLSPTKRALLELRLKKKAAHAATAIPRRAPRDSAPLSFAQQRLWFLNQLEPEGPSYNQPKAIRLIGLLDMKSLQEGLDQIVARHEVLRTNFDSVDGTPAQVIAESRNTELPMIDLRARSEAAREAEVQRLLVETIQRPFDLSRDLMLRALLVRLGDEEHILLLVTHHIACDAWSSEILWEELTALYRAFASGHPLPLRELPVQYVDYAAWQRNWLQGEILETQLSYWRKQLENIPTLQLPTDRPRPRVQSYRGAKQSLMLSKDLSDGLKTLSRQQGVTLFMTLLAAFQTLLHRYTGQEDIVVGSPIAGRTQPEIENLIGFFVNTLVLRGDLSGNPTFLELLRRVREVCLGAYSHQDLPFEKLVEELQPERNLSNSPLFQVMFAHRNVRRQTVELPGLTLRPIEVDSGTAKFDLTLSTREKTDGLMGSLEYSTDLFDEATITRLLNHFQTLLKGIVEDPNRRLSDLPLLTEAERHQLIVEWNDVAKDYPRDKCIHELFEAQVERTPDAVAVVFEDQRLTYCELNRRANQLAHYLQKLGVGPEVLVGLCVDRSLEMVIGLLGILKVGGAYVPLDPTYPSERLAFMLQDTQAPVLLTQQTLRSRLPPLSAPVICLDMNWPVISREPSTNPCCVRTADTLAYVMYTSGSTGKPKGVAMTHRPLTNLIDWHLQTIPTSDGVRVAQFAPLSFDVSFQEIFSTLSSGGTLVLLSEQLRRDPLSLLRFLAREAIGRLFVPFVMLQQLAEAAENTASLQLKLQEIITAGEQLHVTPQLVHWFQTLEQCTLHNHYGPTESHVVTTFTLTGKPSGWPALPPIGRPIANTRLYILDRHLQPVPIGVPGELYIGGDTLARGYLNRPELTAEKFISNPISDEPGACFYKTGDFARYLPDGNIEFLGRLDHQVKIRGFRIELGEIEAVLRQHGGVGDVVVLAHEDIPRSKRLVAYIVPSREPAPTSSDLRNYLKEKLPEYMVPSTFLTLEKLPLTPNGKVNRRALPVPHQARPELEETFVAPRTPAEKVIAGIWAQLLKLEQVGIHDNFFDLGGHSLLAVKLISRLREEFQIDLTVRVLFESPTIAQLAARIEARGNKVLHSQGEKGAYSHLVELQTGRSQKRIFCFAYMWGVRGEYSHFFRLARYMGPDYSFYGLQAQGADGVAQPHGSIEDLTADYVREIQTLQPHGPYFLVGECGGGPQAYETARQLWARGEKVALLALLDTRGPYVSRRYYRGGLIWRGLIDRLHFRIVNSSIWRLLNYFLVGIAFHLRKSKQLEGGKRWHYLLNKTSKAMKAIPHVFRRELSLQANTSMSEAEQQILQHMARARKAYRQNWRWPYGGRITVVVNELWYGFDSTFGWADVAAGGVEVHRIPGDHDSYMLDHDQAVAERLKACMEKAGKEA